MGVANKSAKSKKPDPKAKGGKPPASAKAKPPGKAAPPGKPAPATKNPATPVKPHPGVTAKPVAKKEASAPVKAKAKDIKKPAPKVPEKKVSAAKPAIAKKPEPAKAAPKGKKEDPKALKAAAAAAKKPPAEKKVKEPAAPKIKVSKASAKEAPATGMGKSGASAKSGPLGKAQAAAVTKAAKALAASRGSLPTKVVVADVKPVPVKKAVKAFFHEVQTGAERIIKRGDKSAAAVAPVDIQARRKGGGEESPEELVERIERELEHQHIFKRNVLRPQLCTKCGINVVSDRFTIDKELGYCDDCAEILHLGETKEARKIDFHPSLMKKDGEGGAEGPEAAAEDEDDEDDDEDGPPAGKAAVEPD